LFEGFLYFPCTSIGLMTYSCPFMKWKSLWSCLMKKSYIGLWCKKTCRSQFYNLAHPGLYMWRHHYQWLPPYVHGVEGTNSSAFLCITTKAWFDATDCLMPLPLGAYTQDPCSRVELEWELHFVRCFQIPLHFSPKVVIHWKRNSQYFMNSKAFALLPPNDCFSIFWCYVKLASIPREI
jgi:hypothetical protein